MPFVTLNPFNVVVVVVLAVCVVVVEVVEGVVVVPVVVRVVAVDVVVEDVVVGVVSLVLPSVSVVLVVVSPASVSGLHPWLTKFAISSFHSSLHISCEQVTTCAHSLGKSRSE